MKIFPVMERRMVRPAYEPESYPARVFQNHGRILISELNRQGLLKRKPGRLPIVIADLEDVEAYAIEGSCSYVGLRFDSMVLQVRKVVGYIEHRKTLELITVSNALLFPPGFSDIHHAPLVPWGKGFAIFTHEQTRITRS